MIRSAVIILMVLIGMAGGFAIGVGYQSIHPKVIMLPPEPPISDNIPDAKYEYPIYYWTDNTTK